jgi:small subunit ribosomal protein S16
LGVKIRLKRIGKRQQAYYRVIVMDNRKKRDGRSVEDLGYYQPWIKAKSYKIDIPRYDHWVKQGATPSVTVEKLLERARKAAPKEA